MKAISKKVADSHKDISDWQRRFDQLTTAAESVLDLEYLDSLIDEPIKDEFVMIPFEDPSPRTSYQTDFGN